VRRVGGGIANGWGGVGVVGTGDWGVIVWSGCVRVGFHDWDSWVGTHSGAWLLWLGEGVRVRNAFGGRAEGDSER
jgi:hypothetical protein